MATIQYQILRYLPDRVSGEFINLGIVAFDSSARSLESKFIYKFGKISGFFPDINDEYLIKLVRTINDHLARLSLRLQSELQFSCVSSIDTITSTVLPKDDSSLFFSKIKSTIYISLNTSVNVL